MSNFFIVPPRKVVGSSSGLSTVSSLNALNGDVLLDALGGLSLSLVGQVMTLSITPNTFLLKSGDVVTGNLRFQPQGGAYGLGLFATDTDPAQNALGAVYFNTAQNTLRLYNGASWENLAQSGALSQVQADARYLKLDASNGPITGNLSLGSATLGLGVRASDPSVGTQGQLFFSTASGTIRVYAGGIWGNVGSGVTSIAFGTGLIGGTVTTTGNVSVDQGFSPNWTGTHTFSSPIVFAMAQTFPISGLTISGQAAGDLVSFATGSWGRIPVGTTGQILVVSAGKPVWASPAPSGVTSVTAGAGLSGGTINSASPTGTLSLDLTYSPTWTGTHTFTQPVVFATSQTFTLAGLSDPNQSAGDIAYYNGSGWTRLPVGTAGQVLKVTAGEPAWGTDNTGLIGTPPDGDYSDGFFSTWTAATTDAKALDDVNQLLKAIAPAAANSLNGLSLTVSGPTTFSAILPTGLSTAWYQAGLSSGSLTTNYVISGAMTLTSPNQTTTFGVGAAGQAAGWGSVSHIRTNATGASVVSQFSLTGGITGASGTVMVDTLAVYNSIWEKATAHITYTQTAEGWETQALSHTSAGTTNAVPYWLDPANSTPSFSTPPSVSATSAVAKWLSGVEYFGLGSTITLSFAAASGIFNRAYHPANVARISGVGMNAVAVNPSFVPAYTDTFDRTGSNAVLVTLNVANQSSMTKTLAVGLYKPVHTNVNAPGATANATLSMAVCTYGTASDNTHEYFFDEAQRLAMGATSPAWSSTAVLVSGNAQVRNGSLVFPVSADYSGGGFSGNQEYQRYFYKTSASTGSLTWGGVVSSDISAYGTGSLNVLFQLDTDGLYFDLGLSVGFGNGTGDGTSRANSKGGRGSGSSGTLLNWSFGTSTTGPSGSGNLGRYRVIIIFRDSVKTVTSIASA